MEDKVDMATIFILSFYGPILTAVLILFVFLLFYILKFRSTLKKDTFSGQHVVITGGSSGIGKSVAVHAAARGANVTIIARDLNKLKAAKEEITKACSSPLQRVVSISLDVSSDLDSVRKAIAEVEEGSGPIFMLINCAGSAICGKIEDTSVDDFKYMMNLNYFGTVFPIKAVVAGMKERHSGHIVITSSQAALIGIYGLSAYSASKFALRGFAEALDMEVRPYGVRVTLCLPPDTDTPGFAIEEKTKPIETKLICQSAGLVSPDAVASQLLNDAVAGKFFSTVGFEGFMMTTVCSGMSPVSTFIDLITQEMDLTLGIIVITFLFFLLFTLFAIYLLQTKNYSYWKLRNVIHKKPVFPFGSVKDLVLARTYIGKAYDTLYKEFRSERFFGIVEVQNPVLVLRDPDLIKAILVNDFDHFTVRTNLGTNPKEYILRHVINMSGNEWKEMRSLLSPAFTSGKMKSVFDLMEKCSQRLKKYLFTVTEENLAVEITNLLARFTMDTIAISAFGVETDSINNANCEFFVTVGAMLKTTKSRFFRRFLLNFVPSIVKLLQVNLIPVEVTDLLTRAVSETVTYREKNDIKRNDFLDTLIKTRHRKSHFENKDVDGNYISSSEKEYNTGLTVEQMTAQAFVFFIAGYTTDTSIMVFCLYEMSRHPNIQELLYQDIQSSVIKHGGHLSYQALQDMTYLDQVVNETLRLYGSGQIIIRTCTQPYNIPDTDIILEKGIRVVIPSYSLHHDSKYFPEPYKFKPDRFTPANVKKRHPFVFLPYGAGPRNCIGRNFGLLQIKVGLATVISNFQVALSPNQEVPIEIDKRCIVTTPANPVFLTFKQRENKL